MIDRVGGLSPEAPLNPGFPARILGGGGSGIWDRASDSGSDPRLVGVLLETRPSFGRRTSRLGAAQVIQTCFEEAPWG